MTAYPEARWHQYEPLEDRNGQVGSHIAFGRNVAMTYQFDRATRILSFDNDFLFALPGRVRYARDYSGRRRARAQEKLDAGSMNRLYVVEPGLSLTGANADNRLALKPSLISAVAQRVAMKLGISTSSGAQAAALPEAATRWADAAAADLLEHGPDTLVLAGPTQPSWVHALVHLMNQHLGGLGHTVTPIEPFDITGQQTPATLSELIGAVSANEVETLLIMGSNPAYTGAYNLKVAEHLKQIPFTAHMGLYQDETAHQCDWHVPMAHELESWGDARAYDGTVSMIQPLIEPLYQGHVPHELFARLLGDDAPVSREIVRNYWRQQVPSENFETWWRDVLRKGVVPETQSPPARVSIDEQAVRAAVQRRVGEVNEPTDEQLQIVFTPDPTVWDGRYTNNGWLQELPKPNTMTTWDNAVLISPATAARVGVKNEQMIELAVQGQKLQAVAFLVPGIALDTVTFSLGYGRDKAGHVGNGQGFNAYHLRHEEAMWWRPGLQVRALDRRYPVATTQNHHTLEGRKMLRRGTVEEFERDPRAIAHETEAPSAVKLSLYPDYEYKGQQWGMSVDLTACIGCGACTIACQSENNIPVVGKGQVRTGREMHWIRVDRYFGGADDAPIVMHQPVPCMQCENAPCEVVCPTGATQHSKDGLNEMIYNRCIGTRYCSNNCPYKVRRFNFYNYTRKLSETEQLQKNPQVTVRGLGVMEKCTYCVQRIRLAEIEAHKADRPIRDGEIVTACQAVCPTNAIVFGDINDPDTKVAKAKREPHDYSILEELNTRPRTTYLAGVTNPNPRLPSVVIPQREKSKQKAAAEAGGGEG